MVIDFLPKKKMTIEEAKIKLTFEEVERRLPFLLVLALKTTPQNPKYHPEGNVYNHIKRVYEKAYSLGNVTLMMCALFHDMGKINTTTIGKDGEIHSIGHEDYSWEYIFRYKHLFKDVPVAWLQVANICVYHIKAHLYADKQLGKKRSFSLKMMDEFEDLMLFEKIDDEGKET